MLQLFVFEEFCNLRLTVRNILANLSYGGIEMQWLLFEKHPVFESRSSDFKVLTCYCRCCTSPQDLLCPRLACPCPLGIELYFVNFRVDSSADPSLFSASLCLCFMQRFLYHWWFQQLNAYFPLAPISCMRSFRGSIEEALKSPENKVLEGVEAMYYLELRVLWHSMGNTY